MLYQGNCKASPDWAITRTPRRETFLSPRLRIQVLRAYMCMTRSRPLAGCPDPFPPGKIELPEPRAKTMAAFRDDDTEAQSFDYAIEAELFSMQSRKMKREPMGYRRFSQAADAIRFAIETLPPAVLAGTYLEVDEVRFDSGGIRRLYDRADYPFARRAAA
jgi:hypothetical protein